METVPLRCSSCGADLEAPRGVFALVCGYCGTRHVVKAASGGSSADVSRIASDVTDIREAMTGSRFENLERSTRLAYLASERLRLQHALSRNPGCLVLVLAVLFFVFVLDMFRSVDGGVPGLAVLLAVAAFVAVAWALGAPKRRVRRLLTTVEHEIRSLGG